jgi:hypothetical protein
MEDNVTVVFHGFLNLATREKMEIVNAINEYFDSTNREPIRAANEDAFTKLGIGSEGRECKCCGR